LSGFLSKLAMREISRRKRQAVLIIIGLMISTAVITGSLVVGDSMEYLVYTSTFDNLGEVDLVISGGEFFDYYYYSALSQNTSLDEFIDKHAPIILLPCAMAAQASNLRENKANLYGFDSNFLTFGAFTRIENNEGLDADDISLASNEIVINAHLAANLELDENDNVQLFINNPAFQLNSVYSESLGANAISKSMVVKYIVKQTGLGRLQLDGRTHYTSNIFMNLNALQELLKLGDKINSILISNIGNEYTGLDHEDEAVESLKQCLNSEVGTEELGFAFNLTGSTYLRLTNKDIFFDDEIYDLILRYEGVRNFGFVSSSVLTYFVNSITLNRNNKSVNYSMVTGLDFEKDSAFGDFLISDSYPIGDSVEDLGLSENETMIIDWAADKLDAQIGDTVTIEYMALDRLYNIYNTTHEFTIKYIINLTGKAADPQLMPAFPGLEGKPDCADWDPPFTIELTRISQLDREYWLTHRGTPKAYITLAQAQSLWSTNLGEFTMIKLNTTTADDNLGFLKLQLNDRLDSDLGYSAAGLSIDRVKSDALDTARGMAVFPMMFLAFGSAIIIAGIALIITIFLILADARKYELSIGRAIGLRKNQVIKLFLFEGALYGLIAGIIGVIFGLFLGWSLVYALNSIWSSAVESYTIPFYFKPISLIISFFVGFAITIITIYLTARHIGKMNIISALHNLPASEHSKKRGLLVLGGFLLAIGILLLLVSIIGLSTIMENSEVFINLFAPVLILLGLGFVSGYFVVKPKTRGHIISILTLVMILYIITYAVINFSKSNIPTVELFFSVGLLLVFGVTILTIINLRALANALINLFSLGKKSRPVVAYSLQNPTRRVTRTGQLITIFTLVIFLIAALSINIAIQQVSVDAVSYEQRGGYDIIGETAVPISIDLENASQRIKHNIDAPILDYLQITEIKMVGPQGGTCSNMNVRYPPRLLGVDTNFIQENDFQFMETRSDDDTSRFTWLDLEKTAADNNGRIPIIVDYNTLVWIYGGALGEIYTIDDEAGETIDLEVIGILENSVFGGTFIMSENNLEHLYPVSAEYRYALFKIKPGVKTTPEELASDLERELYQYGMDAQAIRQLILENQAYERSFMVLFQAFLALGLIVGVIGLGVVTARNVQERRFEIGILRALGFNRKMVLKALLLEPAFTGLIAILLGSLIGILSAFLAFGAWAETDFKFVLPWAELGLFAVVIYIIVLLAAAYPAYRASKLPPAEALQRVG